MSARQFTPGPWDHVCGASEHTPELVARVAEAMCLSDHPDTPASARDPIDWLYWGRETRLTYERRARVALKAAGVDPDPYVVVCRYVAARAEIARSAIRVGLAKARGEQ